jgi:hypothetical protein
MVVLVVLGVWVGIVFYVSVKFIEGPHITHIYANREKSQRQPAPSKKRM